jgi:hypothetical protein
VTARYQGPGWLLPIVQRYDLPWFDRIEMIEFNGAMKLHDRWPHLARLKHLRYIDLNHTEQSEADVAKLRRENPAWNIGHTEPEALDVANDDELDLNNT